MDYWFFEIARWFLPPFFVYLIHPVFMGMVIPSRLKRWWHFVLLAAFVALFNIPKAIWGIYSLQAEIFRVIAVFPLLIGIPLLFFEGPVWKRILVNLLMFSSQAVGEGVAVWAVTTPTRVRIEDVVANSVTDSLIYMAIAIVCIIMVDSLLVIFARSMQGEKFLSVYIPLICIVLGLWGTFYAYISDASGLVCCICMLLAGGSIIALLYYVVSLEKKAILEEELLSIRHRMALEQAHYRSVEIRQEEMARIRHDFNNQLAAISLLIRNGEERDAQQMIERLGADIAETKGNHYCAIPVVNAVLAEKEKLCREKNIGFCVELDIPRNLKTEPLHLCSVFANLMDNAIHGVETSAELPANIQLSSAIVGDYLLIKTVNSSACPQKPVEGHGYGSRILKELAEQYGGSYQGEYENGIYTAVVALLI